MSYSEATQQTLPPHVVAWKSAISILVIAPWTMAAFIGYWMTLLLAGSSSSTPFWALAFVLVTSGLPFLGVYAVATSIWTDKRSQFLTTLLVISLISLSIALCLYGPGALTSTSVVSDPSKLATGAIKLYLLISGWLLCLWEIVRTRQASGADGS